jgi:predicted ribonuclease YlaK
VTRVTVPLGEDIGFLPGTEEEKMIFNRMANANNRFTLHARLQELLEFRKIYGPEE